MKKENVGKIIKEIQMTMYSLGKTEERYIQ